MVKIHEFFNEHTLYGGASSLTNEFIYNNSDDISNLIPVYTGSKYFENKYVNFFSIPSSKIFSGGQFTLKFNRKGDVKFLSFIEDPYFTTNDDVYIGYLNPHILNKYNLSPFEFCGFVLANMSNFSSSESGNGTFNKEKFLNSEVNLNSEIDYASIYDYYKWKHNLKRCYQILKNCREVSITFDKDCYSFIKITELFDIRKGSSIYTDKYLYNNSDDISNLIPVYTGALEFENKFVNSHAAVNIISSPSIRILKDGVNAGIAKVMQPSPYVINSHALVLIPLIKDLDLNIYSFILRTFIRPLLNDKTGNPTLNINEFKKISVPIIYQKNNKLSHQIHKLTQLEKIISNSL
ncbi:hypothetical protein FH947_002450 [Enterococcus faecalis]|uniref:restriction endonuclease subunit S n=1 Tax=Enterococcus sp. AZ180 TaxID=2774961 RepID=UPI00156DA27A|nr:hypothetical protein [Enterococcus faecalis]EGO8403351.1 hypothetical protein [Enterococcus faecalis]EHL0042079.1 hypothetical protein [Enterococcus faecalis]EKK0978410.1 hypothetical protein [Enterococcus faecalis]EKZ0219688.1 hypothetical protein [Enterococcus faecalis]